MGKRSGRRCRALLVIVLSLAPTAAFADKLTWLLTPTGTISYAGYGISGSPLIGANIGVASVQDTNANGVTTSYNIVGGLLSFNDPGADSGTWSWGALPKGTLILKGCISGVTDCTSGPAALLIDDFTFATLLPTAPDPVNCPTDPAGCFQVQLGNITGTINSALAGAFGVSTQYSSALYNTTVDVNGAVIGSAFNGYNRGGTINSTVPAAPYTLPEPSSLTLLGFGLVAMAGTMAMRRKV